MKTKIDYMLDKIIEHERLCNVCQYRHDCSGGITGGPNSPIYPPCCEHCLENFICENLVEEVYQEILEEEIVMIKRVLFNDPATIVWWEDGTKTVVKADEEMFDPEKGLAMAIAKKYFGNKGSYWNVFKEYIKEENFAK